MYKKLAVYADDLQQLNTIYYKFVPREFLTLLGKNDIKHIRLGDNIQKEMAILFSDIRGFTTQSEKMSPSESFEFINSFLGEMSPVIRRHNGFIDKYIGDAIMALFPLGSDDAIKTALEMCETLNKINQKLALQNKPPVTIGIGIHYGKLMLGTVGESERMESTVISDAVNLASRLEQLTKEHNSTIIISEAAYDNASSETISEFKPLGEVTVKGKNIPVTIFGIT